MAGGLESQPAVGERTQGSRKRKRKKGEEEGGEGKRSGRREEEGEEGDDLEGKEREFSFQSKASQG